MAARNGGRIVRMRQPIPAALLEAERTRVRAKLAAFAEQLTGERKSDAPRFESPEALKAKFTSAPLTVSDRLRKQNAARAEMTGEAE